MYANMEASGQGLSAFIDGYIMHFLQRRMEDGDADSTGLYQYYEGRVLNRSGGLVEYEFAVAEYLLNSIDSGRSIIHVGIGIGTTTAYLAARGRRIAGIELDQRRMGNARQLRNGLQRIFPHIEDRYFLIEVGFPESIDTLEREGFHCHDSVIFLLILARQSPNLPKMP